MKSFDQIVERLKTAIQKMGPGAIPALKQHSKRNRAPNPFRRAHKPLYGGWAHQLYPRGMTPALTIDQVRMMERILKRKIHTNGNGVVLKNGSFIFGQASEGVTALILNYMNTHNIPHITVGKDEGLRKLDCAVARIPFKVVDNPDDYEINGTITFEKWYEENEAGLSSYFEESGMSSELDSDFERFCEERYEEMVTSPSGNS